MIRSLFLLLATVQFCGVLSLPTQLYDTQNFKVGVEYDHSMAMAGGSDRYRHRNNYDPFFVSVTVTAKRGYVLSYMEVTATVDIIGEVDFTMIRGNAGATTMVFQLVSNNTDFLSYSYMAYGIRVEEYQKITNTISLPMNKVGGLYSLPALYTVILAVLLIVKNS